MRIELSEKNLLENKEMDFKNGIKNIQVAGYNGAHTVANFEFPSQKLHNPPDNNTYLHSFLGIEDEALLCVRNRERRLTVCSPHQLTDCLTKGGLFSESFSLWLYLYGFVHIFSQMKIIRFKSQSYTPISAQNVIIYFPEGN